jgi:uncharacterized protein (DUF2236 family)
MGALRDRIGEAVFARVAGPDGAEHRERIHGTPGPRWFAPDSAIARVHGDASMFVGGMRAIILQTLHPAAMRAVSEHSGYRGDMWGRLARTSHFLAVTTFGTADDAQAAVDLVRRIHAAVNGTMPDGSTYAASDPHLLAWVHAAEVDSFLRSFQAYGVNPLDQAGRDAYVGQVGEVAARLGVLDPPRTEAELGAALASYRPELRGTPEAREAVFDVLWRPPLPVAARPPYAMLRTAAIAMMPDWSREPLGLPSRPLLDRTVARGMGQVSTATIRWALSTGNATSRRLRDRAGAT